MKNCIPPELVSKLKESINSGKLTAESVTNLLPKEREALKAILEEYVAEKLGVTVKAEEVQGIKERSAKIEEAQAKLGDDLGNPNKAKENLDFFKAKKEMDDYLYGLNPANRLKILTGTIGRGVMLASVKTPLLNIGSNAELAFVEALSRRINNFQISGANNKLAIDYVKFVNKVYKETGYDLSRMTAMKDAGVGSAKIVESDIHSQGPGAIRKAGRIVEDLIFKKLMGAPDVAFSSAHFADSVNLNALKLFKDKTRATEIMNDAMRLEPRTSEGELLREQAILDAQVATWTNRTWASKVSIGIRKILNDITGDARVGDYLLPFVKTGANVVATGMDYAGGGIVSSLVKTAKAIKEGKIGSKEHLQSMTRDMVRSGIGLTAAVIIASQLTDEDFVGAYDPKRAQIESLRNSNYNAIRVGDKWISTDWLGPLAVPVTAIMYSRRLGNTFAERKFQYSKAVLRSVMDIPGIKDIYDTVKAQSYQKNQTLEEMTGATSEYISSQLYSRLVPSLFADFAKAVDPNVRQSGKGYEKIVAKIPFLSKTLPVKKDIFGQPVKGESATIDVLFGSRVKTDRETPLIKEISRLSSATDKGIAFTDWDKSSAKTIAEFKKKVGQEKFDKAKIEYGQELKKQLEKTISDPRYSRLSDENKLKVINEKDSQVSEKIMQKYGFKYRYLPNKTIPKNL